MLRQYRGFKWRLGEDDAQTGEIGFGAHLAVNFKARLAVLFLGIVGNQDALDLVGRAIGSHDTGRNVYVLAVRKMRVSEAVGKLVLAARHNLAPRDAARQQKLEGFGKTGLALAVRTPNDSDVHRQVERLLSDSVRPEASNGN